ncbi:754_t:CDS:2 [Ambispora leptoticha]|uniref:754_t:CDS:1 n=1 Tax=Ambispora leptoticha TaxID=144679 RepID=A0A9N8ZPG5_9GLOM|nr:754_t:CDS:2 [Ambispora leptoticha]
MSQDLNQVQEHPFGVDHDKIPMFSKTVLDMYENLSNASSLNDKEIRLLAALKCFLEHYASKAASSQTD